MTRNVLLVVFSMAIAPVAALAVDGVVLINQATVTAAGGFPYVISQPGSYKLSGRLVASDGASGIRINASNVTLDLNGFSIEGSCSSFSCFTTGIFWGGTQGGKGLVIRNGIISGFNIGMNLTFSTNNVVTDMTLFGVSGFGTDFLIRNVMSNRDLDLACPGLAVNIAAARAFQLGAGCVVEHFAAVH